MRFLHNPFDKDVDLNTILYRITYPEYFEDSEFADEEEPHVDDVIFGQDRDLEEKLTWSYGVDCWRAIYAELDAAINLVQQEVEKSGKATEESLQLRNALQEKFDICLRAKTDLESAAEDARIGKPIDFLILAEKSLATGSKIYFRKTSVSAWSLTKLGIPIPEWAPSASDLSSKGTAVGKQDQVTSAASCGNWEDITIKLLRNSRITHSIAGHDNPPVFFQEVGLADRKTGEPNQQAKTLADLAAGKPFGDGEQASTADKTCKSRLKKILIDLVGIESDPFYTRNDRDGYRAKFKLIDLRNDADERAKRDSIHHEFKESADFEEEDDEAGDFLRKHDR